MSSLKYYKNYSIWHTVANIISLSRVGLLPLYVHYYLAQNYTSCLIVSLLALSTDMFDGVAARQAPTQSAFGHWVDPICDAIAMFTITALFFMDNLIPIGFMIWLISRYLIITFIALLLHAKLSSNILNKISIVFFAIYGYSLLFSLINPKWYIMILPSMFCTIVLQAASLIPPIMQLYHQKIRVCKK